MTQMIYRPQTGETLTKDRNKVHKLKFRDIPCDALIVLEQDVPEYLAQGWFAHPDDMLKDEPKPRKGRKANDRSDNDSQ